MPIYVFQCPDCGDFEELIPITAKKIRKLKARCKCGRASYRNFTAEGVRGQDDYKPYFSQSRGVIHASERLPGEIYNEKGDLLIKSRNHHKAMMKKTGTVPLK